MFRCYSYTIIRECLLPNSATYRHQYGPNICSLTTTVLTTHRCVLMDYVNNCKFSKHKLMRSPDDGVTVTPKHVGVVLMYILILFFEKNKHKLMGSLMLDLF